MPGVHKFFPHAYKKGPCFWSYKRQNQLQLIVQVLIFYVFWYLFLFGDLVLGKGTMDVCFGLCTVYTEEHTDLQTPPSCSRAVPTCGTHFRNGYRVKSWGWVLGGYFCHSQLYLQLCMVMKINRSLCFVAKQKACGTRFQKNSQSISHLQGQHW